MNLIQFTYSVVQLMVSGLVSAILKISTQQKHFFFLRIPKLPTFSFPIFTSMILTEQSIKLFLPVSSVERAASRNSGLSGALFFSCFFTLFRFLKLYLEKAINIAVVGNVPSNVFFNIFPRASLVWPFLAVFRGKSEIFGVPNFGQKRQKTRFFSN